MLLRREPKATWVRQQVLSAARVHAPHVIDVEVLGAIRRNVLSGAVRLDRCEAALLDFASMPIARFSHRRLLARAWELRDNVTAADALYVALAEVLEAPLVTTDASLARAPGLDVEIRCFE